LRIEEYRSLVEAIPHLVFVAEPNGEVEYYNQRYADYLGIQTEDSDDFERILIHPDDFDACQRRWNESIATGLPYEIEYRLQRASDGEYRWHLGRALPISDDQGRIIKWFGTCTDIHDQKMAEEEIRVLNAELEQRVRDRTAELERSNVELANQILERKRLEEKEYAHLERLKRMVDILPLGVVITDEAQSILHVNERFCALFDIQTHPSLLIGQSMDEVMRLAKRASADPLYYLNRLQRMVDSQERKLEEEVQLANGNILLRDYLPIAVHGRSRGHVFLYRDITQERRIDAAKSEFMSLASHQLRTPLTSVRWAIGRLAKLLKGRLDENEAKLIASAKDAVMHMASSIDTMLTISRIESGKVTIKREQLSLPPVLEAVMRQERASIGAKGLQMTVDCNIDSPIETDASFLTEILANLLNNAVKYTPAGGRIAIRCSKQEKMARIDVEDTGWGIPQHQQQKIFSKFFRGDNVLKMHTDGTGLGLYLAYRLVQLLEGHLSFVSQEGKGTTFTLTLPIDRSTAGPEKDRRNIH
jgi:PAS domain S-box-containing protein